MRVELELAEPLRHAPVAPPPAPPRRERRPRIDAFDLAVLGILGALSLWVLALDLWQVLANGRVWTGTDGIYLVDQMQYLSWIKDASHHFLSSNLFVLRPTPADYFQPAITISAGLTALGVTPWLSLILWKPVAVVCVFLAARAFVRGSLSGTWPRRAGLVLAVFYGSFTFIAGSFGVLGDLQFTFLSWGYTFGLLAVALMLFALIFYDRARAAGTRIWLPGLLGAIAALLHPWQGEQLIVVVLCAELFTWVRGERDVHRLILPTVTVLSTGLALLYYLALGHLDLSWQLAQTASKHDAHTWTIVLALAPLALPALLGYRRRPAGFLALATRVWLPACAVVYVLSLSGLSATPLHAFDGSTVPLAVLAVQGLATTRLARLPRRRRRLCAAVAVAAVTIPATVYLLDYAAQTVAPTPGDANFITHDEQKALDYLARDPEPGGVLTRFYLGSEVPGDTGRRTFVGDCLWSEPDCSARAEVVQDLFEGALTPRAARSLVQASGARFVLSDCQVTGDLAAEIAPITVSVRRFGCAAVFQIDP